MRYVIVTGASGGMGKAAVEALKEKGFFVFALDIKGLSDKDERVVPIEVDLTDTESIEKAKDTVKNYTDSIYAIVHFAGIYCMNSLVEVSEESYTRVFDINVFGAYRVNKCFLPMLKAGSRIVITSSELATLDPLPFTGIYAITKSALDKYAYSLRMELQLLGISVSVIRPGAVKTDMLGVSTNELDSFCESTKLYSCNSKRFKKIVNSVEAKNISATKIGALTLRILTVKKPRQVYSINRNPLLIMLNVLPKPMATRIIKWVLSDKKGNNS